MNKESRKELTNEIAHFMLENREECLPTVEDYRKAQEILETLTDDQLWRLYFSFVRNNRTFRICGNSDHLGITFAGMYVGIERDGYAHS